MCMQVFLFYVVGLCGCFFVAMWVFGGDFAVVYLDKEMLTPLLTRTQVLLTRISCLTLSLRWLTLFRVLLTPHPYKGSLPKHERKGLERGAWQKTQEQQGTRQKPGSKGQPWGISCRGPSVSDLDGQKIHSYVRFSRVAYNSKLGCLDVSTFWASKTGTYEQRSVDITGHI